MRTLVTSKARLTLSAFFGAFMVLQFMDLLTTVLVLGAGGGEANPFMDRVNQLGGPFLLALGKVALVGVTYAAITFGANYMTRLHASKLPSYYVAMSATLAGLCGFYAFVVFLNIHNYGALA